MEEIEKTTTGPERKAALCGLLEKEAELIAGIGQHRLSAGREAQEKAVERFLDAVSRIHSIYTRRGVHLVIALFHRSPSKASHIVCLPPMLPKIYE